MEEGYCKGETCNRDGCQGIIEVHETDTSCSCHINPPCSHCTTSREYCPVCEWDGKDEQRESEQKAWDAITPEQEEDWRKQREKFDAERERFFTMFRSKEVSEKFEYRQQSTHTGSTQEIWCITPPNQQPDYNRVKGTFGGRWKKFDKETGRFIFIAYTD